MIALVLILAIILFKFKPCYKVIIAGEDVGYTSSKKAIRDRINEEIQNDERTIDFIDLKEKPEYKVKLINRNTEYNVDNIVDAIKDNSVVTYKYYDIAVKDQPIYSMNKEKDALELIEYVKEENKNKDLELSIIEKYTQNEEEIESSTLELAKEGINEKVNSKMEEIRVEEEIRRMPDVNGIKLATKPVTGIITSRYGERSRIRVSTHTGLDIGAATGTDIQVVADGVVTCAGWQGPYGKMIKVSHGNGVETWYAHTSKMYVNVGDKVKAKDVIAAVGSTGNSTGPHLHFEIRINGQHVNPQNYLYK